MYSFLVAIYVFLPANDLCEGQDHTWFVWSKKACFIFGYASIGIGGSLLYIQIRMINWILIRIPQIANSLHKKGFCTFLITRETQGENSRGTTVRFSTKNQFEAVQLHYYAGSFHKFSLKSKIIYITVRKWVVRLKCNSNQAIGIINSNEN